ncbi:hypothetical protein OE749_05985 [Aestuariibacter sp. AA17]|uniref:Zinc ribbon domain-containing protein n=1 Tax=Fluctibacter corallii TaxID=2984329 RepID=A0ABT3A6C6_9ALTE|nr:hypothetical protein [Aestuariibacter sp. AA17]MCV2884238.1 hypothetical protein [Aestuariibacter sp. AA17]
MALTNCPSCNKTISDKAKSCQHCGFAIGSASADDILRKKSLQKFQKHHSIQNQSMLAMLMFIAGFGFMYWGGAQPGDIQHTLAIGCSIVGFGWYIVNRVRLIILKRKD